MTHDHWCGEHHGDWIHDTVCGADYIAICPECDQSADGETLDQEDREAERASRKADEWMDEH
jgi:hypothetical protein